MILRYYVPFEATLGGDRATRIATCRGERLLEETRFQQRRRGHGTRLVQTSNGVVLWSGPSSLLLVHNSLFALLAGIVAGVGGAVHPSGGRIRTRVLLVEVNAMPLSRNEEFVGGLIRLAFSGSKQTFAQQLNAHHRFSNPSTLFWPCPVPFSTPNICATNVQVSIWPVHHRSVRFWMACRVSGVTNGD